MHSGILLLDKPLGLSSNAALQRVRRSSGARRRATSAASIRWPRGMLPICLGEATKIAGDILAGRKCYRFTIALGSRHQHRGHRGRCDRALPVPALARHARGRCAGRFPRAPARRSRRCTPRSSRTASRSTGWRAPASAWRARRARSTVAPADAPGIAARQPGARGAVLQGHLRARACRGDCAGPGHLRARDRAAALWVEPFVRSPDADTASRLGEVRAAGRVAAADRRWTRR